MDQSNRKRHKPKISSHKFERMQWDPGLRERKTMTDYLAAALRTAIYDGQFADNEELNQVELADFFGVSRVPIREALRQLQAEGTRTEYCASSGCRRGTDAPTNSRGP